MNNEPVAWMGKDYDGLKTDLYFDAERNKLPYRLYESAIPLYTLPIEEQDESFDRTASHMAGEYVSYKSELTDEEIAEIAMQCSDMDEYGNSQLKEYEFARAILRKAQNG